MTNQLNPRFLEQSVYHLLSEQRLVYYMQIGRETLWPGGKFVTAGTLPTEAEQDALRIQAERKLVLATPGNSFFLIDTTLRVTRRD